MHSRILSVLRSAAPVCVLALTSSLAQAQLALTGVAVVITA